MSEWFNQHRLPVSQQIEIYSDDDNFYVYIDETKVLQYKHRVEELKTITKVQVVNDVKISSLEITKKHFYWGWAVRSNRWFIWSAPFVCLQWVIVFFIHVYTPFMPLAFICSYRCDYWYWHALAELHIHMNLSINGRFKKRFIKDSSGQSVLSNFLFSSVSKKILRIHLGLLIRKCPKKSILKKYAHVSLNNSTKINSLVLLWHHRYSLLKYPKCFTLSLHRSIYCRIEI